MAASAQVSIVLPTLNERDNIVSLMRAIKQELDSAEIIVVDDDSPDGTWNVAGAAAAGDPSIRVVRRRSRGLRSAIQRGIDEAAGEIVLWMDADFSMPPSAIPRLLSAVECGADVAKGSRYVPGGRDERVEWLPRMASALVNFGARCLLGGPVRDFTAGFVAARRSALERIDLRGDYGEYCIDFLVRASRAGFSVDEVGYVYTRRQAGESKTAATVPRLIWRGRKYVATILRLAVHRHA
jgi:dolichol-phosphate mannosyltransferase